MKCQSRSDGDAGVREHGVIAAAFVRIRPHDPPGVARAAPADREVQVVQETAFQGSRGDLLELPHSRMRIRRPRPDRGRVRLLLDQERAAGLGGILAGHVQREHVAARRARVVRMGAKPLAAAIRLSSPQMNVSVRSGGGSAPLAIDSFSARASAYSVPQPLPLSLAPGSWTCATITIRSPGRVAPANFRNQRPAGSIAERRLDRHPQQDGAG